jgi:hypothetical protein
MEVFMELKTIEQILKVISLAAKHYSSGNGIDRSYQYGVNRVSQEYSVAYQTIGDGCRRRLGLSDISEFKRMLQSALEGDPIQLRELLMQNTSRSYHDRINDFFSELGNGVAKPGFKTKEQDILISYSIHLRKNDSDILKALAQLLGGKPEQILADVAVEAIKDRMKKAVSQL